MEQTPGTSKALLGAVIGMGLLIVAGTVTLVGVIIHRMNAGPAHPALSAHIPLQDAPHTPLSLPAGTRLISMTRVEDNLLALHVSENGHEKVLLWRVSTQSLLPGLDVPQ